MTIKLTTGALFATALWAMPVSVTLENYGSVGDGLHPVLPYVLSIDGVTTLGDCYSVYADVSPGESWSANELTLAQAVSGGQFANLPGAYQLIGELAELPATTPQEQIDKQHNIWNVADPGLFALDAGMKQELQEIASSTADLSNLTFLEGTSPYPVQPFVLISAAPEPVETALVGIGIIGIAAILAKRRKSCQQ